MFNFSCASNNQMVLLHFTVTNFVISVSLTLEFSNRISHSISSVNCRIACYLRHHANGGYLCFKFFFHICNEQRFFYLSPFVSVAFLQITVTGENRKTNINISLIFIMY